MQGNYIFDKINLDLANFAFKKSLFLCENCDWYHGIWPYLRLLNIGNSSFDEKEFFVENINKVLSVKENLEILISGTADHGMLQAILEYWPKNINYPSITVVDICQTTLEVNKKYGDYLNLDIKTIKSNILEFCEFEKFDLIITHAFLGYFNSNQRKTLIKNWFNSLKNGGKLLTINRIRENMNEDIPIKFTDDQTIKLIDQIKNSTSISKKFEINQNLLMEKAYEYSKNKMTYPISSANSLKELFINNGFAIEFFETYGKTDLNCGPTTKGNSIRSHVVAIKK